MAIWRDIAQGTKAIIHLGTRSTPPLHSPTTPPTQPTKMVDTRPIPTISDEHLELLTDLRLARSIVRRAGRIQARAGLIRDEYFAIRRLPHAQWLEALIHNMRVLEAEEEAACELETEIWSNLG
ncbi:hypothetical protein N7519_001530 [Penicillium mononematosum]|uniref:uncharacterized protein n=1 Tax=Penicillium mononematosum TaxID=268346 RepID=UPI002548E712|nr:uncharacterized protein N7519_001530 [Penicillium mononematosum]KAJ6191509.1 hypothetical protein N7519_001530 [Penicillium mononematosum]